MISFFSSSHFYLFFLNLDQNFSIFLFGISPPPPTNRVYMYILDEMEHVLFDVAADCLLFSGPAIFTPNGEAF